MTLADAVAAHDEALSYGGRSGIVSLHLIESAISRPYSGYHKRIHEKAAALLHSCVSNHGFVDGNKRTGWLLVELFIARSGYRLTIPEDAPIDDIVVDVVAGRLQFDDLATWFESNLERASGAS